MNGKFSISMFGLAAFLMTSLSCSAETQISGVLQDGLRIITLDTTGKAPNPVIYRGDYVVFKTVSDVKTILKIPGISVEQTLPMIPGQGHITFRDSGTFDYTLGDKTGRIIVMEYVRGGYTEVSAKEAVRLIEKTKPLILDVRTPGEHGQAKIKGSMLIPVQELELRISELKGHKNKPILIYCASGNRSTVAAKILMDNGFKRIFNLRRGIREWAGEGLPLAK